mgnify:CR=1 FL=1
MILAPILMYVFALLWILLIICMGEDPKEVLWDDFLLLKTYSSSFPFWIIVLLATIFLIVSIVSLSA